MCGIAGFNFTPDTCINAREVSRALLKAIQPRGREATGYAYMTADGRILNDNLPVCADEFCKSRAFQLDAAARSVILHTRLATQGTVKNPLNNHPVLAYTEGSMCGAAVAAVHNGSVYNDDDPFKVYDLPRYAQVDSEAIPALIALKGSERYYETFHELEGGIATGWLDERTPDTLHLVRASDSPMTIAAIDVTLSTGLKIKGVVFASTVSALTAALSALGLSWATEGVSNYDIEEGQYLSVTNGVWDEMVYPFTLPEMWGRYGGNWRSRNYVTQGYDYDWTYYGKGGTTGTTTPANPDGLSEWEAAQEEKYANDPDVYGTDDFATVNAYLSGQGQRATEAPIRNAEEYVGWWKASEGRADMLEDLASRMAEPMYFATAQDMALLAMVTDSEAIMHGFDPEAIVEAHADFSVHAELCQDGICAFTDLTDVDCPLFYVDSGASRKLMTDLSMKVADRWGLDEAAALAVVVPS